MCYKLYYKIHHFIKYIFGTSIYYDITLCSMYIGKFSTHQYPSIIMIHIYDYKRITCIFK